MIVRSNQSSSLSHSASHSKAHRHRELTGLLKRNIMSILILTFFLLASLTLSLAATNCPVGHFWDGTSCQPCSFCPPGFGLKEKCKEKRDTVCQACWPGFDYSNSSDMEPCTGCDKYSNCLTGNAKVIKNCTIFSGTVCQGCAEGSYFDRYELMNGACVECSPPCGMFEKEVRSCKTEHDRLCSQWTTTEIFVPSSPSPVSTESATAGDENDVPDGEATPLPEPSTTNEPLHEKSWFWGVVSSIIVVVIAVVVFTAVKCRNQGGQDTNARATRHASTHGNDTMLQQRSPLMPRGLELPISDLSLDQKMFIAQMLNGKESLGYFYWERIADKVGLKKESSSWSGLRNPTEAFLTTYGEKSGSTVGTLINALRQDGLTHFADQIERKFSEVDETAV